MTWNFQQNTPISSYTQVHQTRNYCPKSKHEVLLAGLRWQIWFDWQRKKERQLQPDFRQPDQANYKTPLLSSQPFSWHLRQMASRSDMLSKSKGSANRRYVHAAATSRESQACCSRFLKILARQETQPAILASKNTRFYFQFFSSSIWDYTTSQTRYPNVILWFQATNSQQIPIHIHKGNLLQPFQSKLSPLMRRRKKKLRQASQ